MSFRRCVMLLLLCCLGAVGTAQAKATTWYVRADGGARGQCDGKADAAYPGHGSSRHCAFGDARLLWDQHEYNKLNWIIAGGDTVILDNTKAWRVGWDQNGSALNTEQQCMGWSGGPYGCLNQTIPAGTPAQPTRILGRNWEHCSAGSQPDKAKMTEMFGGHGVYAVLNLAGAQYVDVQCLNLTRHSACAAHGEPRLPKDCSRSFPLDDYDSSGITTDVHTHDVLLQDLWVHGHTDRGIIGAIGGLVTANRVDISTNGMAGWDLDDGRGTPSVNGVLRLNYTTVEWSGCNQEYPATSPTGVLACYGQSDGGYGDGVGTPTNDGMDVYIDHSVFRYNTQDGEDFGHIDTGNHKLSITNSLSYGNGGGQFKWGANFQNVVFANNVAIGNCTRMARPIPGTSPAFDLHLHDFCRAYDAISFDFRQGATVLFDNNTVVSYAPTTFDVDCWDPSCSDSKLLFRNNIVMGYENKAAFALGGKPGGPGGFYFQHPIGHVMRSNNLFYGIRYGRCEKTEICADPKFVAEPRFNSETDLDNFNVTPAPNSPARGAAMHLPDLHTDFTGKPRGASGNTIGAIE